ncbi:ATP-binding protein [Yinghuangia sp. ASG 101]|uniref:ATP-binding protein n=1 Tax=Yinghuangia sp. ASG 101 TaxID=2896848 RepID=UPI001E4DADDB|nr:ATP-binding protein [Yinghuangia sp. ASG 101]UGQ13738.1 ATP-binding protein [Yinghuangia sp. ASG 101]
MAEDVRHFSVELSASNHGVRRTRHAAERVLHSWGMRELADVTALLLSELLTNVLLHVGPGAWHLLTLRQDGPRLYVEVRDASPRLPVSRGGNADDEFGRGLKLLACLAETWGVDPFPGGKAVWFTMRAG